MSDTKTNQCATVDSNDGYENNLLIEEGEFHVPSELREMENWICYRLEEQDGKTKKVPRDPQEPAKMWKCDPTDPDNGVTFSEAMDAVDHSKSVNGDDGYDGVGFQLIEENDVAGVDFDDVIDEDGVMDEWAYKMLMSCKSFAEVSPSRNGAHTLVYGELDSNYKNRNDDLGLEMYEEGRFFTVTGRWIEGTPKSINSCPDGILKAWQAKHMDEVFINSSNGTRDGESDAEWADIDTSGHPGLLDYDDLTKREQKVVDAGLKYGDDDFHILYKDAESAWNHDRKWNGGDKSRCDLSLISKICFWCQEADMFDFNLEFKEIERIFLSSNIADRPKTRNRPDYVRYTINKILSSKPA